MPLVLGQFRFYPRTWINKWFTHRRFMGALRLKPDRMEPAELHARLQLLREKTWPSMLQAPVGRRLLVIAPHPDDETIACGGLLLAHRGLAEVHVVNIFSGAAQDNRDYGSTRSQELHAAARLLGCASVRQLDFDDGAEVATEAAAERLREAVEEIQPDVVLLPWLFDGHRDHRMTNVLYAWGCADLPCMVLGYEVWSLCPPNAVFDITHLLEEKLQVLQEYRSQAAINDYDHLVRGMAAVRGFEFSKQPKRAGAAEAFLSMPGNDYASMVRSVYGQPGALSACGRSLL